jgi:hypothetical protein
MGRANIVSNGFTLYPVTTSIRHDRELVVEDERMASGMLRRVFRGVKEIISYEHDDLSEADLTTWLNAHPVNTSYTHTDELNVTRTVVTDRIEYAVDRNVSTTERRYVIAVTVKEV